MIQLLFRRVKNRSRKINSYVAMLESGPFPRHSQPLRSSAHAPLSLPTNLRHSLPLCSCWQNNEPKIHNNTGKNLFLNKMAENYSKLLICYYFFCILFIIVYWFYFVKRERIILPKSGHNTNIEPNRCAYFKFL